MCGIIGIIGSSDVAKEIHTGLLVIQHRGQDSCGIVTSDREQLYVEKGPGLVSEFFNDGKLALLKGNMGVGHVRYPTVGSNSLRDSQPLITGHPSMGMAHNGNIVNYSELYDYLTKQERKVISGCDAEIILKLLATEILELTLDYKLDPKTIFTALESVMGRVNGSYSVAAVVSRNGLLGFRDPHGIRPMVFGKKEVDGETRYAFASESVALDVMDYKVIKDLEPGEAIFIDEDLNVTSKIIKQGKKAHCFFEWIYFARPDSVIENKGVYQVRLNLGRELARLWVENDFEADITTPVPDSGRTAASTFSTETNARYREALLKNRYVGRTFIMPTNEIRKDMIKLKLNPIIRETRGKSIALIDDSIVRGNTSRQIIDLLKKAGAKEVHFFSTAPPLKYPCYYGIDFSTHGELIASNKAVSEIEKDIGADSLTYQTIEGLKRAVGLEGNICTACLTGEYPTEVGKYKENLEKTRACERSEE